MSFIRRAAVRALFAPSTRQITAFGPVSTSRVTSLPSARPCIARSFHQIRATWADFENRIDQEEGASETVQADPTSDITNQAARTERRDGLKSRTVYVGNLFFDVKDADLHKEFSKTGEIESAHVVVDGRGMSKGFGFVVFQAQEDAEQAIKELHQQIFQGRRLVVSNATGQKSRSSPETNRAPRRPSSPTNTLFVGGLPRQMTDRDLNNLFAEIRNVVDVRVAIDRRTGQPRGFAHADFIDVPSAERAKEILETQVLYGRSLRVDWGVSSVPSHARRDQQESGSGEDMSSGQGL